MGCGHGYMTLAMAMMVKNGKVTGVDIHEKAIERCREIQQGGFGDVKGKVEYVCEDIDKDDGRVLKKQYDIIHCGFFVKNSLHEKLLKAMKPTSLGIWPIS